MALTQNNCAMIKALAENDIPRAKRAAIASCVEDTSKKNAWFTEKYEKVLSSNSTSSVIQSIPANLKWKLVGELPENFVKDRYYLSDREKEVFNSIYRMKAVSEKMQDLSIPYRNSTLLYGKSGTGKTMFGKYVAHRLQLPFFYLNFSQMIDSYLGSTAQNINRAFQYIRDIPCVFMIDEIDCIATRRSAGGGKGADGEIERTTIAIMQELDQMPGSVVLIAATNRPDLLDDALVRRFSIVHEVLPLSKEENHEMVRSFLENVNKGKEEGEKKVVLDDSLINSIITEKQTPADIMTEVIQQIGKQIYEEIKDTIPENPWEDENEKVSEEAPVYEVTFSKRYRVTTREGKEDAVKKARARSYSSHGYGSGETAAEEVSVRKL